MWFDNKSKCAKKKSDFFFSDVTEIWWSRAAARLQHGHNRSTWIAVLLKSWFIQITNGCLICTLFNVFLLGWFAVWFIFKCNQNLSNYLLTVKNKFGFTGICVLVWIFKPSLQNWPSKGFCWVFISCGEAILTKWSPRYCCCLSFHLCHPNTHAVVWTWRGACVAGQPPRHLTGGSHSCSCARSRSHTCISTLWSPRVQRGLSGSGLFFKFCTT